MSFFSIILHSHARSLYLSAFHHINTNYHYKSPISVLLLYAFDMLAVLLEIIHKSEQIASEEPIPLPPPPSHSSFLSDWWLYLIAIIVIALAYRYLFPTLPTPTRNNQFTNTTNMSTSNTTTPAAAAPRRDFTLSELAAYNGTDTSKPLYLGCNGLVFDVSNARGFYGPGAAYGVFAGRDASRGLARMEIAYTGANISDLSGSERQALKEVCTALLETHTYIRITKNAIKSSTKLLLTCIMCHISVCYIVCCVILSLCSGVKNLRANILS